MKYRFGHVTPWWTDSFKDLDYVYYPLKNTHDEARWLREGYDRITLNGGLYNMSRPMPEDAQPFLTMFDWQDVAIAFYRMNTLDALPLHTDTYTIYSKMFNVPPDSIWRCIVFLENWKSGHYFEIGGSAHLNWQAGDYAVWNNDVPHYAGNFGTEPRYTMQITGHL
jgi:hypothetical protein